MTIAAAFLEACLEELAAPKPGNVHIHAPGHRMTVEDFARSAEVSAPLLCRWAAPLGRRILDAATATREAVGQNTNLGILLLCAPLAMAAERANPVMAGKGLPSTALPGTAPQGADAPPARTMTMERHGPAPAERLAAREAVQAIIAASGLADADAVFAAIRLANPGGLGSAERHDVRLPATVTLSEAMAEAAGRDTIARQWTNGFADILGLGLTAYAAGRVDGRDASLAVYLAFLSAFPDSHVARKHGAAAAAELQRQAARVAADIEGLADKLPRLLAWDAHLKSAGINPGTSADMTVATAFAWRLGLRCTSVNG